jgi:hypothetical protein
MLTMTIQEIQGTKKPLKSPLFFFFSFPIGLKTLNPKSQTQHGFREIQGKLNSVEKTLLN